MSDSAECQDQRRMGNTGKFQGSSGTDSSQSYALSPGRADIHTHTHYSGFNRVFFIPFPESITPPDKMVDAAVKKGLNVLCVTDHDEIEGAFRAQRYAIENRLSVEVVAGEEIGTLDGEVIGLFLQEHIQECLSAEETIDLIHDQGGLAVAPHPFSYRCHSLDTKISELSLDGMEVMNGAHRDRYVNQLAENRAILAGVARTGGSDAHSPRMLGDTFTEFQGRSAEELYQAIKRGETAPGGKYASLGDWILWSMEIAHGVGKRLIVSFKDKKLRSDFDFDDPLVRMDMMRRHNRLIAMGGCMVFLLTPLPLVCGVVGEVWIRWKGHRKWEEFKP